MDYIFYRIFKYYSRFKNEGPVSTAVFFLFFVYLSILFFVGNLVNLYADGLFSKESKVFDQVELKWIYGILCAVILLFNFVRYNKTRRKKILSKYANSRLNESIKTWQIFILPILVFTLSIVLMKLLK